MVENAYMFHSPLRCYSCFTIKMNALLVKNQLTVLIVLLTPLTLPYPTAIGSFHNSQLSKLFSIHG